MNNQQIADFALHLSALATAVQGISKVFGAAYPSCVPSVEPVALVVGSIGPDGKKVRKPKRDPDMPKRALSTFLRRRQSVQLAHPELNFGEVQRTLAKLWIDCDPATKQRLEAEYAIDKLSATAEMEAYNEKNGIVPKKRKAEDKQSPKMKSKAGEEQRHAFSTSGEESERDEVVESEESESEDSPPPAPVVKAKDLKTKEPKKAGKAVETPKKVEETPKGKKAKKA